MRTLAVSNGKDRLIKNPRDKVTINLGWPDTLRSKLMVSAIEISARQGDFAGFRSQAGTGTKGCSAGFGPRDACRWR